MAMIRDMMPTFDLFQPGSVGDAVALLDRYGSDAWTMGGGLDTFEWLKERIRRPAVVVDLGSISELRGVRTTDDGIEIGAMTTLTEVIADDAVTTGFGLVEAFEVGAGEARSGLGTLGILGECLLPSCDHRGEGLGPVALQGLRACLDIQELPLVAEGCPGRNGG